MSGQGLGRPTSSKARLEGTWHFSHLAQVLRLLVRRALHAALTLLGLFSPALTGATPTTSPNIIIVLTDDQGYADLGVQGVHSDVSTPNLDQLAKGGIRFTSGYAVAPQCVPSRAGLLTGMYPQRLGVHSNSTGPLPLDVPTIAEKLQHAGYRTGFVGKWHLEPNQIQKRWIERHVPRPWTLNKRKRVDIPRELIEPYLPNRRGFTDFFIGAAQRYLANFDLKGESLEPAGWLKFDTAFRIDTQTAAALAFIDRAAGQPFFLLLSYNAPHVPLEAPAAYLREFAKVDSERRRYGLAMISAIDSGVGKVILKLNELKIDRNTLVVFLSDHGAPLGAGRKELPISDRRGRWNGSLNDPWPGEKGTLLEGGIRVPLVMHWPGGLPRGVTYEKPVLSLDVVATALALAELPPDPRSDGTDLVPYLSGQKKGQPHDAIYWKWGQQAAVRLGDTKLIVLADGSMHLIDPRKGVTVRAGSLPESDSTVRTALAQLENWLCSLPSHGFDIDGARIDSPLESDFLAYYLGYHEPKSASEIWSPACPAAESG